MFFPRTTSKKLSMTPCLSRGYRRIMMLGSTPALPRILMDKGRTAMSTSMLWVGIHNFIFESSFIVFFSLLFMLFCFICFSFLFYHLMSKTKEWNQSFQVYCIITIFRRICHRCKNHWIYQVEICLGTVYALLIASDKHGPCTWVGGKYMSPLYIQFLLVAFIDFRRSESTVIDTLFL